MDVKKRLKRCGENVTIDELVVIINPENIEVGNNVRIDAFVKIVAGNSLVIGDYVHIASFSSIWGGGDCEIGDFVTFSYGVRIITGGDEFLGGGMTGPMVPMTYRVRYTRSPVIIGKHTILGTNTIVHPGANLGEGTATGSGTIVTMNKVLQPWNVWLGAPARRYKERRRDVILRLEKELRSKE